MIAQWDFKGQVVVVTGASGGIGSATADLFALCGARVVCVDLRLPGSPQAGRLHLKADVASFEEAGRCVRTILEKEGTIDCLINNAGISRDSVVWKMSESQWDEVLNVNLKGAFNFIRHTAPHLREKKRGRIVNISSINALRGKFGLANYSAAKAGLIGLTRTIARELGGCGVNVNAVAPGLILTPLTQSLEERFFDQAVEESALKRISQADDVAQAVAFLCSHASRQITGQVLTVDGGQTV